MALKIKNANYIPSSHSKHSYKLPFIDSESENHTGGLYSSHSSGFYSPESGSSSSFTSIFNFNNCQDGKENNFNNDDEKLKSIFDSFNLDEESPSNASSIDCKLSACGRNNSWERSPNSLFDSNDSKQFDTFGNFVQSTYGFSDCSMFSYSPLSSFDSVSYDQSYNDLYYNDLLSYQMQQECIRRDFEMNGISVDEALPQKDPYNFHPMAMSTPFAERKSDQYKLNNTTAENISSENMKNQQMSPKASQINNNIMEMIHTDSLHPPISLTPFDANQMNKSQGRKRNHQKQFILPNQFQMSNINNPNHKFGSANSDNRKMAKKSNTSSKKKLDDYCVFCKNNGVDEILYKSHTVKDSKGRVLCPKLRAYQCPICGEDGDKSHTIKYCPKKPIVTMEDLKKLEAGSKKPGYTSKHF